jgi:hypothetical protein
MLKQATELMRKAKGHHMVHISQWLKSGGGKLLTDSGIQTLSKTIKNYMVG